MFARSIGSAVVVVALATPCLAGTQIRTSAFEYDSASGLLIREIIEPDNSALCLVTTYQYDVYGNRNSATTRNCNGTSSGGVNEAPAPTGDPVFVSRTSSTDFAAGSVVISGTTYNWSAGTFATSSTNALGHTETLTYDPRFGRVMSLTGPNNLMTNWTYDSFGRKSTETLSDGTIMSRTYTLCGGTCPTYGKYFVTVINVNGVTTVAPTTVTYYDCLRREIRSETQGFDGTLVRRDTEYDALGRVLRASKPYYTNASPVWTTFETDVLGRRIAITEPTTAAGTRKVAAVYNGLTTTVTVSDSSGAGTNLPQGLTQSKTTTRNSQGQIALVKDTQNNTLAYTYDEFGNLKSTTDALGNVIALSNGLRGFKFQMSDPDMGTWSYAYNALGELIRQTDAKSQVTSIAYDKLGRMTLRTETDLVSTWTYDSCSKGIGKLCVVSSDNGYVRTQSYDALGRLASITVTIDTIYTLTQSYDPQGRRQINNYPASPSYPSGFATRNVYNPYGYLSEVWDNANNVRLWQAQSESANGGITQELLGNGLTTNRVYDIDRLASVTTGAGTASDVQNTSYTYDLSGNVTQRVDSADGVTEYFAYDTLNRLTMDSGTSPTGPLVTRSFDYNALGNMIYKSDVGTYTYPASGVASIRPHAVSSVAGTVNATYIYDANGNLGSGADRTLTYKSFNLPDTITRGTDSFQYVYGPKHERVKLIVQRTSGVYTTIYLHPNGGAELLFEKETTPDGTEYRHYVNAGTYVVGAYLTKSSGSPEMRYFHYDSLDSLSAITNNSGAVVERLAYEPFGKRRYPNGTADPTNLLFGVTTDRGFTGHEHLDELGLIHMNGRVYDPLLGRFMTPDPFIQFSTYLQSFNRYSYVLNNPLRAIDPEGFTLPIIQHDGGGLGDGGLGDGGLGDGWPGDPSCIDGYSPDGTPQIVITGTGLGDTGGLGEGPTVPGGDVLGPDFSGGWGLDSTFPIPRNPRELGDLGQLAQAPPFPARWGVRGLILNSGQPNPKTPGGKSKTETGSSDLDDALNVNAAAGGAAPPPEGGDNNDNNKGSNKDEQPASEKTARDIAKRIERDLGKDARREFHDVKEGGASDRTLGQLKQDARDLYIQAGKDIPSWLK